GRLAGEIFECLFFRDAVAEDHLLDRDGPIGQTGVIGQVDPAHAAHAEDLPHAVTTIEEMALGKRLTRIHLILSIPGGGSAKRAVRRAAASSQTVLRRSDLSSALEMFFRL